ncbi:MAG: hypothetical protein RLY86_3695 [Pseudomonadota bacterium]|jgi:predicted enzyme related to lactoylglutathione lyase
MSETGSSTGGQPMPAIGTICWNELATRDLDKAKAFYGGLLGWTYAEVPMEGGVTYVIAKCNGKDAGGMMKMEGEMWGDIPSHWMGYIAVADVDASAARVAELGGTVCVPPTDIPNVGRFCVINDPTGAPISLMTFSTPG